MAENKVNNKKSIFSRLTGFMRRKIWTIIMAYMVGIHNFYKEEEKTPDNIVLTIEDIEAEEDSAPKN